MAEPNHTTKTFVFKLKINAKFADSCEKVLDTARFIYNCALEQRISHYRQTLALTCHGETLSYYEQSCQLTEARKELPEIKECLRGIEMDVLKRLDLAFQAFFRRLKQPGVKAGFPRFKGKDSYHTFSQSIESQRGCPLQGDILTVPGVGTCRVWLSRNIVGTVKQLRITRRASGWYAALVCEMPKPEPLAATGLSVGIDAGITDFATLSNGEAIANPRHLKPASAKLKLAQQRLAKKKKGSVNRRKARRVVALKHERVANGRKDFHHKVARKLVKRFDVIVVEALCIKGMVQNHCLAKSISDVGWGQFFTIIKSKAENAGRRFEKVNPAYTSQTCSGCTARQKMPLNARVFKCANCYLEIGRDHNAALNILGRGAPPKPVELRQRDSETGISECWYQPQLFEAAIPDLRA